MTLVHGPGCPVCVTPLELIDKAIAIARRPEVIFTSFGDMMRVPGSESDLLSVKAQGGDVRMVYSPLDAVKLAQQNPDRQVVFFAVGFETTAPANAMAVWQAKQLGLANFSILCSHVLVPPAMEAILGSPHSLVQGFLAAGHVCAVMGYWEYDPIAEKYQAPIVVTGFEPLDLLQGIYMTVKMLEEGRWGVENQYSRAVTREGLVPAQELLQQVFQTCDRPWRGIGVIPASGYCLQPAYEDYDADKAFRCDRHQSPGIGNLHRRRDHAGPEKTARVPRLWHALHAGKAAGRADGLVGRRVRGVLSVWTSLSPCKTPMVSDLSMQTTW